MFSSVLQCIWKSGVFAAKIVTIIKINQMLIIFSSYFQSLFKVSELFDIRLLIAFYMVILMIAFWNEYLLKENWKEKLDFWNLWIWDIDFFTDTK